MTVSVEAGLAAVSQPYRGFRGLTADTAVEARDQIEAAADALVAITAARRAHKRNDFPVRDVLITEAEEALDIVIALMPMDRR